MTCYILDTDHLSLYERAHPKVCARIIRTRQHSSDALFTTVVSLEEQYAGRIAQIRKAMTPQALVGAYDKFKQIFALFSELDILEYDIKADEYFRQFRKARDSYWYIGFTNCCNYPCSRWGFVK
jgi:tRNA(fMet)-specific endonuclease VapC